MRTATFTVLALPADTVTTCTAAGTGSPPPTGATSHTIAPAPEAPLNTCRVVAWQARGAPR